MRARRLLLALFLGLAFVIPTWADDKKDDDKKPDPKDKATAAKDEAAAKHKKKLINAGEMVGKIIQVEDTQKALTIEVKVPVPNPGEVQALANVQAQLILALRTPRPDLNRIADLRRQLAQHQAQSVKYEPSKIEVQASDDVIVRRKDPPVEFDDKGNPKKYTQKELKALRGKYPWGFPAEFDDLAKDQTVRIFLTKNKDAPKVNSKASSKDKDQDKEVSKEPKVTANKIYILDEGEKK